MVDQSLPVASTWAVLCLLHAFGSVGVNPLETLHVMSTSESLTTHTMKKGSMTSVNPLVQLQTNRPGKALTAYITNKGFMINVDRLVSLEVNSVGKPYCTNHKEKVYNQCEPSSGCLGYEL